MFGAIAILHGQEALQLSLAGGFGVPAQSVAPHARQQTNQHTQDGDRAQGTNRPSKDTHQRRWLSQKVCPEAPETATNRHTVCGGSLLK